MGIEDLGKPAGKWCEQCAIGSGCRIYETRPEECRLFECGWKFDAALGPDWRPDRAKFLLQYELGGKRLAVRVDPQRPDAWKREPYYSRLKQMAREAAAAGRYVIAVVVGGRATVIFPDRDVDVGFVNGDERLVVTFFGRGEVVKVHQSDPRAAGIPYA
ncbi:MAG: hypothetical protein JO346_09145 [Alphaproteobacteria bacterium]|nr:hypothetical protein [Alphaproteobacteria bacterium]